MLIIKGGDGSHLHCQHSGGQGRITGSLQPAWVTQLGHYKIEILEVEYRQVCIREVHKNFNTNDLSKCQKRRDTAPFLLWTLESISELMNMYVCLQVMNCSLTDFNSSSGKLQISRHRTWFACTFLGLKDLPTASRYV